MTKYASILTKLYWLFATLALAGALVMAFAYAPTEATMGVVQKILYLHLPSAMTTFIACFVVFIASVGYLWQRKPIWDDLANAGAQVAVLFSSIVLLTGVLWARDAWGHWWTWSPRLTFSLLLWLLFTVYLVLRSSIQAPERRAVVSAVYGLIAFLDVPLVYVSVKLLPDIHPSDVALAPEMRYTLMVWFIPIVMFGAGLVWTRFKLGVRERLLNAHHDQPALNPHAHAIKEAHR